MYIINIMTAWIGIINGTDSICDLFFFITKNAVALSFMKEGLFDYQRQQYRNGIRQNLYFC